jgi:DNA-binding transcriptional LysR family regulator
MQLFVAIVQNHSFSGAAKQLKVAATKASKDIKYLEKSLDCKLLNRSTRSINVTDVGEMYYNSAVEILEMHSQMIDNIKMTKNTICGELRISAPELWGEMVLAPVIINYKKQNPDVKFIVDLNNKNVDIYEDNIHIAFRSTNLTNEPYYSKYIIADEIILCASHEFISKNLPISLPEDLNNHSFIGLIQKHSHLDQINFIHNGAKITQRVKGELLFSNKHIIYNAIKAGLGIAVLPKYLVAKDLESGSLTEVLPDYKIKGSKFYALYTQRRKDSSLINHFIDYVCEHV